MKASPRKRSANFSRKKIASKPKVNTSAAFASIWTRAGGSWPSTVFPSRVFSAGPTAIGISPPRTSRVQCGFTHFLGFDTPPIFVSRDTSADGNLPRIPVLRKDETLPLNFPSDRNEQQSWWLAFLRVGRENAEPHVCWPRHYRNSRRKRRRIRRRKFPARALEILNGNVSGGTQRMAKLRAANPFDANVTTNIEQTLNLLAPGPRPH